MSFSSKLALVLFVLLAALFLSGCLANPQDTELPWSTPNSWEGTMPLPGSMTGRYD